MAEATASEATVDFCLPSLGADMVDATIVAWNVGVGDAVERGDVLLAVETEKGEIDVETWEAGTVADIRSQPGERVSVGAVIATLVPAGDTPPVMLTTTTDEQVTLEPQVTTDEQVTLEPPAPWIPDPGSTAPLEVSPQLVYWPGPTERGQRSRTTDTPIAPQVDADAATLDPIRLAIARKVSRSNREIPHYHVLHEIDLTTSRAWLDHHNETVPPADRVVMAALLVHATAAAARAVPELNGWWNDSGVTPSERVDVGIILRLRTGGIVTPIIPEADTLTVDEIMKCLSDITVRARNGRLRGSDLADPSITVTNLGDRGVHTVLGIIQPPQLALVGFGRADVRPVVVDGEVCARLAITASVAGDHRATDGLTGAKFLHAVDRTLQESDPS